jgi:hypothetical protein
MGKKEKMQGFSIDENDDSPDVVVEEDSAAVDDSDADFDEFGEEEGAQEESDEDF